MLPVLPAVYLKIENMPKVVVADTIADVAFQNSNEFLYVSKGTKKSGC